MNEDGSGREVDICTDALADPGSQDGHGPPKPTKGAIRSFGPPKAPKKT